MRKRGQFNTVKINPCDRKCKNDRNMWVPKENYEMHSDLNKY